MHGHGYSLFFFHDWQSGTSLFFKTESPRALFDNLYMGLLRANKRPDAPIHVREKGTWSHAWLPV
jgi:hypothetical protein